MYKSILLVVGCLASFVLLDRADAQVYATYYAPAVPVAAYYAPAAPVVYTSYYTPAAVVGYQPVAIARTRYRPVLGGSVTRVRPVYRPFVVNPMPVVYGY